MNYDYQTYIDNCANVVFCLTSSTSHSLNRQMGRIRLCRVLFCVSEVKNQNREDKNGDGSGHSEHLAIQIIWLSSFALFCLLFLRLHRGLWRLRSTAVPCICCFSSYYLSALRRMAGSQLVSPGRAHLSVRVRSCSLLDRPTEYWLRNFVSVGFSLSRQFALVSMELSWCFESVRSGEFLIFFG